VLLLRPAPPCSLFAVALDVQLESHGAFVFDIMGAADEGDPPVTRGGLNRQQSFRP
jgi:hypothetical protein